MTNGFVEIPIESVRYMREDDAAIERYRAALHPCARPATPLDYMEAH